MAKLRVLVLLLLALPLAGISSFETLFAPRKDLWEFWAEYDPNSQAVMDYGVWDGLLKRYLREGEDGLNRFAYGGVSPQDKAALDQFLAGMSSVPIRRYNLDQQLAYWVNLYNALTVQVVLDHYPVDSIRDIDISPGLFADGPWGKKLIEVEGEPLSLDDIEHRILRPIWDDPRLHYAVNCAAVGCPNLQKIAFTGTNSEYLLDGAARSFINSPRGVWETDQGIAVSSIYAWFPEDFGDGDEGVLDHLRSYADPDLLSRLEGVGEIADHDYDWRLNDAAAP